METEDTKKASDPGIKYMIHRTQKRGLDPILGESQKPAAQGGLALRGSYRALPS